MLKWLLSVNNISDATSFLGKVREINVGDTNLTVSQAEDNIGDPEAVYALRVMKVSIGLFQSITFDHVDNWVKTKVEAAYHVPIDYCGDCFTLTCPTDINGNDAD